MNTKFSAKKLTLGDKFTEYCESELSRLDKFFTSEADATVSVTPLKDDVTTEIAVKFKGMLYRAESTAAKKEEAFDDAVDKIVRQIRRNKTRLKKRLRDTAFEPANFEGYEEVEEEPDYNVVKRKRFFVSPMSVEEAILQMNMLGHEFFMFRDAETDEINVVYKRKDGDYAVLEPEK